MPTRATEDVITPGPFVLHDATLADAADHALVVIDDPIDDAEPLLADDEEDDAADRRRRQRRQRGRRRTIRGRRSRAGVPHADGEGDAAVPGG